jgi:hypothetical protein
MAWFGRVWQDLASFGKRWQGFSWADLSGGVFSLELGSFGTGWGDFGWRA